MKKLLNILIQVPRYMLALLFVYTAATKLINYAAHLAHIRDIGFVPTSIAENTAKGSIAIELAIAVMLFVNYKRAQVWGWRICIALMLLYSYYVFFVLNRALFIPCSCQGVSDRLTWTDHYWLNGLIAAIALGMLYYHYLTRKQNNTDEVQGNGSISTIRTV